MGLLSPALAGTVTAMARGAASSTPMFTERPTCAVEKAETAVIGREIGAGGSDGIREGSPSCLPRACAKGGRPCSWALVGRAAAPTPCPAAPPGCSTTAPGKESSPLVAEEGRRRNGLDSLTLAILAAAPPILLEEEQTSARSRWNVPHRDPARIFVSKNRSAFHTDHGLPGRARVLQLQVFAAADCARVQITPPLSREPASRRA